MERMKEVNYAGGTFFTTDELAEELVAYATVLARHGDAAEVVFPARLGNGDEVDVEMVLGPASQLIAYPAHVADLDVGDAVERLRARRGGGGFESAAPTLGGPSSLLDDF